MCDGLETDGPPKESSSALSSAHCVWQLWNDWSTGPVTEKRGASGPSPPPPPPYGVLCVAERRLRRAPASSHVTRCACHVGRRFGWPHSAPSSGHGRTSSSHKTFEFFFFFFLNFVLGLFREKSQIDRNDEFKVTMHVNTRWVVITHGDATSWAKWRPRTPTEAVVSGFRRRRRILFPTHPNNNLAVHFSSSSLPRTHTTLPDEHTRHSFFLFFIYIFGGWVGGR